MTGRDRATAFIDRADTQTTRNAAGIRLGRTPTMGKLDRKVAIAIGAARGLGRAYPKRLAGLGAKIASPT